MTGDENGLLKLLVCPDERSVLGVHVIGTGGDRARPHRPGGDGARPRRARLPRHRGVQLRDVRGVLQGRRARRGEPDPRHVARPPRGRARRRRRRSRRRRRARSPRASSAAITPIRRSRCSTCASASSFSRSWRAISRSTAVAGDAELAGADALDRERPPGRRAEDAELGDLVLAGRDCLRHRLGGRHAAQQLARELVEARAGRARGDDHRDVRRRAARATPRAAAVGRLRRRRGRPSRARGSAAARRAAASCSASSRSITRVVGLRVGAVERREVEHVDEQPRALDVREEVVAEARRRRWRPRSGRGCRRSRAGGRRPRACRAPARAS